MALAATLAGVWGARATMQFSRVTQFDLAEWPPNLFGDYWRRTVLSCKCLPEERILLPTASTRGRMLERTLPEYQVQPCVVRASMLMWDCWFRLTPRRMYGSRVSTSARESSPAFCEAWPPATSHSSASKLSLTPQKFAACKATRIICVRSPLFCKFARKATAPV